MPIDVPVREDVNGGPAEQAAEPHDYAVLNAVFATLLVGVIAASRERTRASDPLTTRDLAVTGAATFALAKVIAREQIGSWVRDPFVDERDGKRPRGRGVRRAVGELITCTRCVGAWSALGLVGLRLTSPATGRVVGDVLAVSAMNDWLQAAFKLLCAKSEA